jgi:hypothetical protein
MGEWCVHRVTPEETLLRIAQAYGLHWMTLFLMLVTCDV